MREIKFRGRTINGKWVFGDLARYGAAPNCSFISNLDGTFQVIPETVGQYTGLKDQNKVEIYDGDIIKWEEDQLVDMGERIIHCEGKGQIIWFQEFCHFGIQEIPKKLGHWTFSEDARYEVIGNIHQNPDLLKE